MQNNDDVSWQKQNDLHRQVSGTGLQGFAVQSLVFPTHTHHGDPQVGDRHTAQWAGHCGHGGDEAIDVVVENVFTWELEQGGVVAERVADGASTARQANAEAHETRTDEEGHRPGTKR